MAVTTTELGRFMVSCFLWPGALEGSTDSGSGLKRLRRQGQSLKSHRTDLESRGSNSGPLEYKANDLSC